MGWIILAQFILTLAMALNCYPLQPGGLIAIQSVLMGLTNTKNIYHEVELNLKVIEDVCKKTLGVSCMFMWIILAALSIGDVFDGRKSYSHLFWRSSEQ